MNRRSLVRVLSDADMGRNALCFNCGWRTQLRGGWCLRHRRDALVVVRGGLDGRHRAGNTLQWKQYRDQRRQHAARMGFRTSAQITADNAQGGLRVEEV